MFLGEFERALRDATDRKRIEALIFSLQPLAPSVNLISVSQPRATQNLYPREPKDFLMSCSAEDIATILEALPAVTVESPLPAFEQLAGNDAVSYTHLTLPTNREV